MSGVLAVLDRRGRPLQAELVSQLLSAVPGRAVDGQHDWTSGPVGLGHQHFWVLPEEHGETQPLFSPDGSVALSADARLDNRSELLSALGESHCPAEPCSDAALILAAYRRWGVDCVRRLLGDFAFVLWDGTRRELFAAGDALGARCLCYYLDRNWAVVASEILAVLAHPAVPARLNERAVAAYLTGLGDEPSETLYQGVYYLPPGHAMLITAEATRLWRYWDLDPGARIRYRHDEAYAEHYRTLLTEAVRCRLRARGPVAVSLSGGLDSCALAALAARQLAPARLKTFSYVFDDLTTCDERAHIAPLVEAYGLLATCLPADGLWTLRDLSSWPVEPDYVWSDLYAYLPKAVADAAQAAGCRVLLGGYYGDTLFEGGCYYALDMLRERRWRELWRAVPHSRVAARWARWLAGQALREVLPEALVQAYRRWRPQHRSARHPGLHPAFVARTGLDAVAAGPEDWRRIRPPSRGARYRGLFHSSFFQGAAAVRRIYNAQGLELERPYFDRRLMEFVLAVPADQLYRAGWDRWVHRRAMKDLLPDSIRLRRDKTDFWPLAQLGLRRELGTVRAILARPQIVEREVIRRDWLEQAVAELAEGTGDPFPLWLCVSLELWLQRYWT